MLIHFLHVNTLQQMFCFVNTLEVGGATSKVLQQGRRAGRWSIAAAAVVHTQNSGRFPRNIPSLTNKTAHEQWQLQLPQRHMAHTSRASQKAGIIPKSVT